MGYEAGLWKRPDMKPNTRGKGQSRVCFSNLCVAQRKHGPLGHGRGAQHQFSHLGGREEETGLAVHYYDSQENVFIVHRLRSGADGGVKWHLNIPVLETL